jgi:hypothetical protein
MGDLDGAIVAYEHALRHNQYSIQAMNQISCILRTKENFPRAVEYLQAIVKLDGNNGEVWGALGMSSASIESLSTNVGHRPLLFDDGRSSGGLFCLSTSSLSIERSKGKFQCACK